MNSRRGGPQRHKAGIVTLTEPEPRRPIAYAKLSQQTIRSDVGRTSGAAAMVSGAALFLRRASNAIPQKGPAGPAACR
jgi:hypothetical protein